MSVYLSSPRLRFGLVVALSLLLDAALPAQGYAPDEAVKHMTVPDGFRVRCVASEPDVRKPVTISFDDRGRMWVIQYLQYPSPAGLKAVKVDQYLRTVYDRIPEPPPKGPKGADRITILDDPDEHGRYRTVKDFHVGLNLASGMCLGHGGVFVAQPPYLLFYKIKEGQDVADGDPEVLLKGFGMEDAHAFPNSLQWGPDGWLYGAQGSTVTANINGIEFQQGIWRYHPLTKQFELFAEGGGNTWGVDFDRHGNIIAGTNWGGQAMLHQVQGGYYVKGFAKHGPLHNPYTFGYFDHVPYTGFKGGHVTCGGILYTGGAFPEQYQNQYIAANLLSNAIYWHQLQPKGSSFTARFGGDLVTTDDTSFRPVDCLVGPDGAVYIADWCDKRANHVDPVDNWDRTKGRIYKLDYVGDKASRERQRPEDLKKDPLSKRSSKELVALLSHPNDWYCREARRILAERRDTSIIPTLKQMVKDNTGQLALEALWALYVSGGFDDGMATLCLRHANEDVRAWAVRLLGDARKVMPAQRTRLIIMAGADTSPRVRSQLASTAKRLPDDDGRPIVRELLQRAEDLNDPHIPLLLWWAIEPRLCPEARGLSWIKWLEPRGFGQNPIVRDFILERIARRLMSGTDDDLVDLEDLLKTMAKSADLDRVLSGMDKALEGRSLSEMPFAEGFGAIWRTRKAEPMVIRLALHLGQPDAFSQARTVVTDEKVPLVDRVSLIEALGQVARPGSASYLLEALRDSKNPRIRQAALGALQGFGDPSIADTVLVLYPQLPAEVRVRAQQLLCSRPASALAFLQAVHAGKVSPKEVPLDQLQRMMLFKDERIQKLIEKHWGKVGAQSSGEKKSRMNSIAHILRQGKGDPARGKPLFVENCGKCHVLFGEGGKVGPELTGVDRKNRDFLLVSIVDPSAFIRPEFVAHDVVTKDGRILTGLLAEDMPKAVTLLDAKAERVVVPRDKIEEMNPSTKSLMPEQLLDKLDDQQIRDFFAYLQSDLTQAGSPGAGPGEKAPMKVCLISGALEYESDKTLAEFQKYLEANFNVKCSRAFRKADDDLPGLENLETCDVALFFTRRMQIDGPQLERVKKYCQAGKPIVAVRTASHGFQKWLAMDKEILGGNYGNHYKEGPECSVKIVDKAKDHPVLAGVKEYKAAGSLYKNPDIAKDCEVLLTGSIPDHTEPIAWVRTQKGGRVFYTSLGHQMDFQDENFRRLLVNALFWTAKRTPEKSAGKR